MEGTRYNSKWDWTTWLILGAVAACCLWPCLLPDDDGIVPVVICLVTLVFIVVLFLSTYYRIEGDRLIVYSLFRHTAFPIDKIKEVRPTKSALAAPAVSLTHRLAITFTDPSVLKATGPLMISPVRQEEFINQLLSINPAIIH